MIKGQSSIFCSSIKHVGWWVISLQLKTSDVQVVCKQHFYNVTSYLDCNTKSNELSKNTKLQYNSKEMQSSKEMQVVDSTVTISYLQSGSCS